MSPPPPRDAALDTLTTLREAGHTAYFAGGCVRDQLLDFAPKDYDVATNATPEKVQQLFPRSNAVGAAFGVVLVYHGHGSERVTIEVATFRTDGTYTDGRRPDHVTFTDAKHDAQRRDFTINGLFEDPVHPETNNPDADDDGVIDYVGGRADLKAKLIRAIGDPHQRFDEDYLRMLRAVRFATRFGFTIERDTADAIREHAPKLERIARERIGDEVRRMITGPAPADAAHMLHEVNLDTAVFGLRPVNADSDCDTLRHLDRAADYAARLVAWLDADGPRLQSKQLRNALSLSNEELDHLRDTRSLLTQHATLPDATIAKRKRAFAHPRWPQAALVIHAQGATNESTRTHADWLTAERDRLAHDGIGLAPDPLLTGDHLVAAGFKPSPSFRTTLDAAYDAQLEDRVKTTDQALRFARTLIS